MKIVLPPRLRAGLLAALLLLTSFATSDAQAAGVAAQKEDLATASLGTESAYTLTETATPDDLTISKYVYDASSDTTTRINYDVDIKPLGDTTGSGSPSYFAWSADEPLTLQSSTEAEADVTAYAGNGNSVGETLDSVAFTNATGTTMAALSQDFVANTVNYGINHDITAENKISTSTGGALNNQGEMTLSTSHFVGNALIASNSAAGEIIYNVHGGAIHNTGSLGAMQSDFIGNLASAFSSGYQVAAMGSVSDYAARALGGASYNEGNVTSFSGDFLANHVYAESMNTEHANGATAYGGAIFSTSKGTIGSITGTLSGNSSTAKTSGSYALALGGAVYNLGLITSSSADYTNNSTYATAASRQVSAGAGAMYNGGDIHYLLSHFAGNQAKAHVDANAASATGGALFNRGQIFVIEGIFTENKAEAITAQGIAHADGGAIYNIHAMGGLNGVFSNNELHAQSANEFYSGFAQARGGGIFNGGTFNTITADFIGNRVEATGSSQASVVARGGGLFNDAGSVILQVTGNFYGNSTHTVGGNETTSGGGAIANRGSLALVAMTQSMEFTGNYSTEDGVKTSNAILNEAYSNWETYEDFTPILRFNAYDEHSIIVNDGISGIMTFIDEQQIIEINSGLDGDGEQVINDGKEFSTIELNNRVEYQTITVHAGTLKLGSYAGGTITVGGELQQVEASSALLYYSNLSVLAEGRVTTDASYLGSVNPDGLGIETTISNSGTIELTSGTLSHAISSNDTGRIEVHEGVTLEAALNMNDSSTIVFHAGSTLNSTLSLDTTGGITNENGDLHTLTSVTLGSMAQITDSSASTKLTLESCTLEVAINSAMSTDAGSGMSYLTAGLLADIASIEQSLTLHIDLTQEIADAFFAGLETEQLQGIWLQDSSALSAMSLDAGIDITDDIIITLNGQQLTATQAVAHEGGLLLTTTRTIPEPSTATLSLLALSAMLLRRRRQTS